MRSEFKEFYDKYGEKKVIPLQLIMHKALKLWLRTRFKHLVLGSEEWHKVQHKMSLLSSTTYDCEIRSLFYETTLGENCKGRFYCLPNVCLNFPRRIKIGYNLFLNRNVNIVARAPITIGDNVIIGPNTIINSGTHIYSDSGRLIRDQGHKKAPIIIENDVFIGADVFILPGVIIGEGSVIGAGSVVTSSIAPYSVAVGTPARVIKRRV